MQDKNEIENNNLTKEVLNPIERKYTKSELALIESVKRIKNPYRMLTVKDIMRDLHICETAAYKTFRRKDFPSINVGKTNQVTLLAYLIWKMEKRD